VIYPVDSVIQPLNNWGLVAHFGHLLMFHCSNLTWNGKRLEQTVNSYGKNILEPFSKELKVVLLYSIKTVLSHLKETLYTCECM